MFPAKGRRKCTLWCTIPRLGSPRVLLFLATLLLIATVVLIFLTRFASPVAIVEQRNYGVVVDAGSSSSKVHLFQWPLHDGDPDKLLTIKPVVDELGDPCMKKVEPGIATFAQSPETAFTSIQPLLEFALSHIPSSHHQHTQLYIFCTAGMRLLPQSQQNNMVQVLSEKASAEYPFHLPEGGVQVISGKLEGVYSWITINYLLGRLNPEHQHVDVTAMPESGGGERPSHAISTVGSLDMGGASLQVAFEIPHGVDVPPESTVDINLGCSVNGGSQHKHKVFVSTYLGYGANEARSRYYRQLFRAHLEKSNASHLDTGVHLHTLRDPCAPLEHVHNVTIDHHSIKIRGLGSFDGCKRALLPLLQASSGGSGVPCPESDPNCSLIHIFERPPLFLKYEALDFYGTSEFWYTMRDVLRIGGHYTSYSFVKASTDFCQTNWKVLMNRYQRKLYMYADFYRLKTQCMKSAWLSLVLHKGLGFPPDSISLHSLASIEGQSVQWALGALLYNTRYLPLREVQLHQLQAPPLSQSRWQVTHLSSPLQSSFLLPFLMVLCVAFLLLCCRQRRPHLSTHAQRWAHPLLHRTQSLNSLPVKIHRRAGSVVTTGSSVHVAGLGAPDDSATEYGPPRNDWSSGSKLKFVV